jgi:hypothetical protein
MRDTTKTLLKALTKHIASKIITGKESLIHQEAVRQAFRDSMSERIAPMIKAAANLQRKEGLPHYLDCYAEHTAAQQQDEGFLDSIKSIGSGFGSVAVRAVADGTGVNIKKLGGVVRAFRKKQAKPKFTTSKVPTAAKKPTPKKPTPISAHIEPQKIDRKDFAASLKAAGGDLRKIK